MLSLRIRQRGNTVIEHLIEYQGNAAVMCQKSNAKPSIWVEGERAIDDADNRYHGEQ